MAFDDADEVDGPAPPVPPAVEPPLLLIEVGLPPALMALLFDREELERECGSDLALEASMAARDWRCCSHWRM